MIIIKKKKNKKKKRENLLREVSPKQDIGRWDIDHPV